MADVESGRSGGRAPHREASGRTRGLDAQSVRLSLLLHIARHFGTRIPLEELLLLLPPGPLRTVPELRTFLESGPLTPWLQAAPTEVSPDLHRRRALASTRWEEARNELPALLRSVLPLVRTVVVTGSVAYGAAEEGADLDFFVITRDGALWPVLLFTFLSLRMGPRADRSVWCFNQVMDESTARKYLSRSSDLLEARELLVARPLVGESYYRDVLRSTSWVRELLPRLYDRWEMGPRSGPFPPTAPAPCAVRLLGLCAFPVIAAYLQVKGLRDCRRLREGGRLAETFRSETRLGRFALLTRKFEELRAVYAAASLPEGSLPHQGRSSSRGPSRDELPSAPGLTATGERTGPG
ncbi:MAG: nucleotidyltransferase domain-containing protein [Euryarchaeota archaeon]|nr:nucleotidyltransferase domain-containing protein [Euryarchaeota archaeon]MDE1835181.1 nucleotidyltransferase domain-containing protein [Euryarchaeota archaeon]MDE1880408.1 nucleotidyltransferase domain-containing protein [Euryarchaeota archaeon]MDE2045723.1 nucleotidyltransferase domain-containing protein [Thermoplasmata archaeon]